ncbi:MAG: type II toxin-antitoxin system RelE/ParE family toxin [Prevotella sp.]|jgi:phage-related protein|nr:type II toxin-antitoxin system RelE/ParE family toxin [Prevotella sp.]
MINDKEAQSALNMCIFTSLDNGQIVVLFNGFQKKTQKTPANEIEKAIKIKEAYYADKQSQNS